MTLLQVLARHWGAKALFAILFLASPASAEEPATPVAGFVERTHYISAIAYSPNGQYLAVGEGKYGVGKEKERELVLWDTKAKKKAAVLKGHTSVLS